MGTAVTKQYQIKGFDTSALAVPEQVSVAIDEIAADMREGLMALAVGAGLQPRHLAVDALADVRSLLDGDQAEDWQQHEEREHSEQEQTAAVSGSASLPEGDETNNDRDGPEERTKQGEHHREYGQPARPPLRRLSRA
jgi:hypothetical protein